MKNKLGLLEQIRQAKSVESVQFLLSEGERFTHAHPSTRNKWKKAAQKRLAFLSSNGTN